MGTVPILSLSRLLQLGELLLEPLGRKGRDLLKKKRTMLRREFDRLFELGAARDGEA
jgi:hypothetical protein